MAHAATLETQFEIYKYLSECANSHRRDALNVAPAFFKNVQVSLTTSVIFMLSKLYDERPTAKRSLPHFLKSALEYYSSLLEPQRCISDATIREQIAQIKNDKAVLDKVKKHRDKYHAHHDNRYFDNPAAHSADAPLSTTEVEQLIRSGQEILKKHCLALFQTDRLMRPENARDVEDAVRSILRYTKLANDSDVQHIIRKHPEYLSD